MAHLEMTTAQLEGLHISQKAAISLAKPDNSEYVLHIDVQHSGSKSKLAACSTDHSVRLYNRDTLAYASKIKGHSKPITGVKFSRSDDNLLYTSSLDGNIRCWDLRLEPDKPVSEYTGYEETNNVFTAFDVSCNGRVLCAGTEAKNDEVYMVFWDARNTGPLGVYEDSHNGDITQISFHPEKSDSLLTGAVDGLVCVFDISEPTEDDALMMTLNAESPVCKLGWCDLDRECIYGITHNNSINIWDTHEFDPMLEIRDLNHLHESSAHVDYVVDFFQSNEELYLLSGTNSGDLDVFRMSGSELVSGFSLQGGHSEVVRCASWDAKTSSLVTGAEDSMLCLWKTQDGNDTQDNRDRRKLKASSKVKQKVGKSITEGNKPY